MPTIIQEDAPHPQSYRPDLPLRSELYTDEDADRYAEGFEDGKERGIDLECERSAGRVNVLERYLADAEAEVRSLQAKLAAKAS